MCGITGWVDFGRDLRGQRAAIEAMTATMICRGPDADGVVLGARGDRAPVYKVTAVKVTKVTVSSRE